MADDATHSRDAQPSAPEVIEVKPPMGRRVGRGLLIVWLVLVVVFAIVNLHWVDFDWIFGETEVVEVGGKRRSGGVPLVLLLAGAFASGLLTGMTIVGLRVRRSRRAARAKDLS
jgi:uncharacterized integral membrane protein